MRWIRCGLAMLCCGVIGTAQASFPERTLRMVVPFAAGSGLDKLARATGERLSRELGQPVVIDNVSGAGGNVGFDAVLKAPKDGYTLLMATTGIMVINPHLYKRQKRTPLTDLVVISPVQTATNVLAVRPELPINNLSQFIAYAKANPGKLSYGSSGIGSSSHLGAVLLSQMAGIELSHIPYRGSSAAASDFLGGRLDFMMDGAAQYVNLASSGKVRVLGTTSKKRFDTLPGWTPLAESGLPGFDVSIWSAVMAPEGVPASTLKVLRQAMAKVVSDPDFRTAVAPDTPFPMSTANFEAFLQTENAKWEKLIRDSGVTADGL
ncbi:tripartite tricarboxylate transporter substrate binding protein [Curvibacter sp. RS43]|uniref:Bug family tripartite tricarboxylate transporter substrate binding protein n=1 Tax=Curvibacter microcysteis TaxID=3026419 RepID=UPI00235F36B8|nr:tripartite tricarboxylate transporter substrate binding protein [Curvibacter sp. RS43]MDD0812845.1 tripartite tricarboxylate transporter substrate binding protein [Curvibacter sp. RS43]